MAKFHALYKHSALAIAAIVLLVGVCLIWLGCKEFRWNYSNDSDYLAFEAALDGKDELSTAERVVLSVEAIEREVNNGGFNQFFVNSSRDFAPFIVESFNLIGCPQTAQLCQKAIDLLGVENVYDSDALEDAACDADDDLMARFNSLDETYYAGGEEPIAIKLFEFIRQKRIEISLEKSMVGGR